jgi:hypothetical protein
MCGRLLFAQDSHLCVFRAAPGERPGVFGGRVHPLVKGRLGRLLQVG